MTRLITLLSIICLSIGCSKKETGVFKLSDEKTSKADLSLRSVTGGRDGFQARAELIYSAQTSGQPDLTIRILLEPGVPTHFISGDYTWGNTSGIITSTSIDFFGGQGGHPSIGGIFLFTSDGNSYRAVLPTTEMRPR